MLFHKCKVKCNEENSNESNKIACEVGCGLKSPYLIDCKNTFKSTEDNSCEKVVESNKCNPTKKRPIDTYYSELSQNKDENGVSIVDGCCKCGGGVPSCSPCKRNSISKMQQPVESMPEDLTLVAPNEVLHIDFMAVHRWKKMC
mgnify:CR=1 FL=1